MSRARVLGVVTALATGCAGVSGNTAAGTTPSTPAARTPAPLTLRVVPLEDDPEGDGGDDADALARTEGDLVAADVAARRASRHGELPPVRVASDELAPDAWPRVEVVNQTPHRLVVWFAGPCARTVGLPPRERVEVEVCAGGYDIAAQLDHPEFLPFVGEGDEVDDGYRYRLTFYVVSEPGRRRPGRLRRR